MMRKILKPILALSLLCATAIPATTRASDLLDLNELIDQVELEAAASFDSRSAEVVRDVSMRDPNKQAEAPATAGNSTSLLDTSSASDLFAVALSFADLTVSSEDDGGDDGSSQNVSATAYAIWSTIARFDPLEPQRYCSEDAVKSRRLAITLGRDDGEDGTDDAFVGGLKYRLPIGKDVCDEDLFAENPEIKNAMIAYAGDRAKLLEDVHEQLEKDFNLSFDDVDSSVQNSVVVNERAKSLIAAAINTTSKDEMDRLIAREIEAVRDADAFALEFNTKQREDDGADEYTASLIWDHEALLPSIDLTANAGWQMSDRANEDNSHGGHAALSLRWTGADTEREGPRPLRMSLAFRAEWLSEEDDKYTGQAKLVVPILEGIEVPISVTVSNRTELIDEEEVRGNIGFTIDTASILASLQRR